MNKNKLFPQINGILHGGDYNAEQWLDRPDILAKDIEMMKEAGMPSATLGVFSWSAYEPVEGEYHFDWLKDVMDNLYNAGIYTVLATPSGGKPAWMAQKYPEIRRVDSYDVRELHELTCIQRKSCQYHPSAPRPCGKPSGTHHVACVK